MWHYLPEGSLQGGKNLYKAESDSISTTKKDSKNSILMQKYYLPISKVECTSQYVLVLREGDALSIMKPPTEGLKQDENETPIYNDLFNNESTVIKNLKDFGCMNDSLVI